MKKRRAENVDELKDFFEELCILNEPSGESAEKSREKQNAQIFGAFLYVIASLLEKIMYMITVWIGFRFFRWLIELIAG